MRFVFLSDTHSYLANVKVPDGDVLVFAGDATFRGRLSEWDAFNAAWAKLPHAHKCFTPGNHDLTLETHPQQALEHLPDVNVLIDQEYVIDGIKLYFSPWTPMFCNWAFMKSRGPEIREVWRKIPPDTDILVTHGPPHKILDLTPGWEQVGCEELRKVVKRIKPRYHVFGHIHCEYGIKEVEGTTFINASVCTEGYDPINPPIVVDIIDGVVTVL
jgi:predicted phosphohydrolase